MNKGVKGFVIGVIVTLMAISIVFADGVIRTIEVAFNTIKLQVNGVDVDADNILYNGTTYVPIRKVAEMFGKDVKWNSETSTVDINENNQISQSTIKLSAVPEKIKINNKEYRLKTVLWRDFMPISPPDGKPLMAIVNIQDENNSYAIDEMTIEWLQEMDLNGDLI